MLSGPNRPTGRMSSRAELWLRTAIFTFAIVLGLQAGWILATELSRRATIIDSASAEEGAADSPYQMAASRAARFGLVRGDLWAESALSFVNLSPTGFFGRIDLSRSETVEKVRTKAEQALRYSPHDARIWLVLATLDSQFNPRDSRVAALLRMSYYTGANEIELTPLRLLVLARSDALTNDDLKQLVYRDIRNVITRAPQLKYTIITAYREASPVGRELFNQILAELDPTLLSSTQL
jgi:hypothetical protein